MADNYLLMTIILAVLGLVVYTFVNVIIRRLVATVRSREDYDADVDGTMTEEEKAAAEEEKKDELEKKKIGLGAVREEYGARFYIVAALGCILSGLIGYFFGLSFDSIVYFLFFILLTIIAFVDLDTMEIPPELNYIILGLGVICLVITLFYSFDSQLLSVTWLERLIGFACISGFLLVVTLMVNGAFGGGDIKLMFLFGLVIGFPMAKVSNTE